MNTVNKTPEQNWEEKMKKVFSETPIHNFYVGPSEPPFFEERQLLPEPDFHLIALEQSGKLPNKTLQQLLKNAEDIEQWLNEPKRLKEERRKNESKRQLEMMSRIQSK